MKKFTFHLIAFLLTVTLYGQQHVFSLSDLEKQGISMKHLDSLYKAVPSKDTIHPVFNQQYYDTIVHVAINEFIENINTYLLNHGFKWGLPVRCINRVYFNSSGKIDYFIYIFKGLIGNETDFTFKKLVSEFISNYKIQVIAPENFSFTIPVMYSD